MFSKLSHEQDKKGNEIAKTLKDLPELVQQNEIAEIRKLLPKSKEFYPTRASDIDLVQQAVILAAELENIPVLMALMDAGIRVNPIQKKNESLLLDCVKAGRGKVVEQLLRNYQIYDRDDHNDDSKQALRIAIRSNFDDIALSLVQAGVDPNTGTFGSSPFTEDYPVLLAAARNGNLQLMDSLVVRGASVANAILGLAEHYLRKYYHDSDRIKSKSEANANLYAEIDSYKSTLKTLLDFAFGVDLCIDFFVPREMDVSGFNFIGLSIKGVPVTPETFKRFDHKMTNNALFKLKDIDSIKNDKSRFDALSSRLHEIMLKEGRLIQAGVVNLVPLIIASGNGDLVTVKTRVIAYNEVDNPQQNSQIAEALRTAANNKHGFVVDFLLGYKKNRISKSALFAAYSDTNDPLISARIGAFIDEKEVDGAKNSKLHLAVKKRDSREMHYLLACGANPSAFNERGETPLLIAIYSKADYSMVDTLITPDSIKPSKFFNPYRRKRCTISPLEYAIETNSDISVIELLWNKSNQHGIQLDQLSLATLAISKYSDGAFAILLPSLELDESVKKVLLDALNKLPDHKNEIREINKEISQHNNSQFFDYRKPRLTELQNEDKAKENMTKMLSEFGLVTTHRSGGNPTYTLIL